MLIKLVFLSTTFKQYNQNPFTKDHEEVDCF